jgi:hypothetical protein
LYGIIRIIKSRWMRWAGHVARIGGRKMHIGFWWGNPKGKGTIDVGEDNIEMDLRVIGWGDMDWIDLAQDKDQWRALVNTAMNLEVP